MYFYKWKEVMTWWLICLVTGGIFSGMAFYIAKYLAQESYFVSRVQVDLLIKGNLMAWAIMWALVLNLIGFWNDGVTIREHGWCLKLANGIGSNVAFLSPFALAIWLA